MSTTTPLARRLGLLDAIVLGLASMIGAGVFVVFAPAAAAAGSGLVIGLGIAAVVALCNALSSAQLAAAYPQAGGAYVYGRERLGEWVGFFAGWSFVIGKTASCAAMALVCAAYLAPPGWERPIAVAVVLVLAAVNCFGITRTALVARVVVAVVVAVLVVLVIVSFSAPSALASQTGPSSPDLSTPNVLGILQSAGLLFFAFAGFARLATLGEEVRAPATTIPRAIVLSLTVVVILYLLVAVALLTVLGADRLAVASAPLTELVEAIGWGAAAPVVVVTAALATVGALLALLTGVGRTILAMARTGDLPRALSSVHPRSVAPVRAEILVAIVVSALVLTVDLTRVIAFSSFGVLLYYLVANLAAFTQPHTQRRFPRAIPVVGCLGCVVLAFTLPWQAIAGGSLVLLAGVAFRLLRTRWMRSRQP